MFVLRKLRKKDIKNLLYGAISEMKSCSRKPLFYFGALKLKIFPELLDQIQKISRFWNPLIKDFGWFPYIRRKITYHPLMAIFFHKLISMQNVGCVICYIYMLLNSSNHSKFMHLSKMLSWADNFRLALI